MIAAERAEIELRRQREERLRGERLAHASARLARTREVYGALPSGAGSLRGRWMVALAITGVDAAVDGLGTR